MRRYASGGHRLEPWGPGWDRRVSQAGSGPAASQTGSGRQGPEASQAGLGPAASRAGLGRLGPEASQAGSGPAVSQAGPGLPRRPSRVIHSLVMWAGRRSRDRRGEDEKGLTSQCGFFLGILQVET